MNGPPPPLARLLAIADRSLIDGLHDALRQRGWTDVRPAYGFVLLAARDQGTTAGQLAALESIYAELEAGWAEIVGRDQLERLRADLVAVLTTPDGALPAVRPTW